MGLRAEQFKYKGNKEFRDGGVYPVPHGITGVPYRYLECAGTYHFDRKGATVTTPIGTSIAETGARLRVQGAALYKKRPAGLRNVPQAMYDACCIRYMDKAMIQQTAPGCSPDTIQALKAYSMLDLNHSLSHPFLKFAPKEIKAIPVVANSTFLESGEITSFAINILKLSQLEAETFTSILKGYHGRGWKRNVNDKAVELMMLLAEPEGKNREKVKIEDFKYSGNNTLADALTGITFRHRELPMELNLRRHFRVEHRSIESGVVPRYIMRHPWGPVFDYTKKLKGGTVLIDNSGSMSLTVDEIVQMVKTAPLSTIAMYEGNRNTNIGYLTIIAKMGRCATAEAIARVQDGGHNIVDYHSLCWLSGMPEPRIWVSDQNVTAVNASCPSIYRTACMSVVRQTGIYTAYDTERALELFKKLHRERAVR